MNLILILKTIAVILFFNGVAYGLFWLVVRHDQIRMAKSQWKFGIYKAKEKHPCFICDEKGKHNSFVVPGFHPVFLCARCAAEHGPDYVRSCEWTLCS